MAKKLSFTKTKNPVIEYINGIWTTAVLITILVILLGLWLVFWPGATLAIFIFVFSLLLIITGGINLAQNIAEKQKHYVFPILAILFGVFLMHDTTMAISLFSFIIAFILLVKSFTNLAIARSIKQSGISYVSGVLGIIVAIFILFFPINTVIATTILLGLYTIFLGVSFLVDLFSIRQKIGK
jgi:uncharacterized membrane protein HdeD (DUF308 family)